MSPPVSTVPIYRVGHQEGIIVKNIDDLDNAATEEKTTCSTEAVFADRDAVEHECHEGLRGSVQPVQVKGSKKAFKDNKDCVEELVLVDLENGSHTPDCLGSSKSESLKDYPVVVHSAKNLTSLCASVNGDTHCSSKSPTVPQRRKRKKKNSKRKTTKRQRTMSYQSESFDVDVVQHVRCCAGGGGDSPQKNQSCMTGNGNCTSTANGTCVVAASTCTTQGTGCGGGGGGGSDDGDDGEDPNKHKKRSEHNLCPSGNRKKTQPSEEEMEVDSSSKDSPMDISHSSKDRAKSDEKRPRPEEKPPEKVVTHAIKQPSQDFLITWNCRINHSSVCKDKQNCRICFWVTMYVDHCMPEGGNQCGSDCRYCKLWPIIFNYHQSKCIIPGSCHVCSKAKPESEVQDHAEVTQEVLNVPTSLTSLDPEEAPEESLIYCDSSIQNWTDFKEHEDYTFKQKELVGKGGNGEVHEVELHIQFKEKHPQFSGKEVVVKKIGRKSFNPLTPRIFPLTSKIVWH